MTFLSLEDPTYPVSLGNISLATKVYSLLPISEEVIICGQRSGYLNLVSIIENKNILEFQLPDKGAHVTDMVAIGESSKYAIVTSRGLHIVNVTGDNGIKHIQTHLNSKDIKSVALVKNNIVLLGFFNSSDLVLYNLENSCTLRTIPNPSKDRYVWRILPLKNYSFLISD